jgi:hypothetical protein
MLPTLKANFARLDFDGTTCRLRYTTGWKGLPIGSAIGARNVPVTALAGVRFEPHRGLRPARLRLLLRPGADPLLAAAGDQLRDSDHPYVLHGITDGDLAKRYAAALAAAVASTGLADTPAGGFLLEEPTPPPLEAKGRHGRVQFDGDTVTFVWNGTAPDDRLRQQRRTLPLSAIEAVAYKHPDHGLRGGYLYFQVIGTEQGPNPGRHPDAFPLDPSQAGAPLLVGAAVVAAIERLRATVSARPPTPRRVDGAPLRPPRGSVLDGLDGRAEFDGGTVTVTARAATRRIPLEAIDWVELVESKGADGVGWVRVHLAGAPPDAGPFDPARDQDTVRHADDLAALDFAHRVSTALADRPGLRGTPDTDLLATAGERPDIVEAMGRASRPARGLVHELRALPHRLPGGDRVQELELAVLDGQPGLVARSARRMLFLHGGRPALSLSCRALSATWTPPDDQGLGELVLTTATAEYRLVGVWSPARLAEGLGPDDTPAGTDVATKLRRLAELHAAGLLSEAEFTARKADLLDRL